MNYIIGCGLAAFFAFLIYVGVQESRQWEEYKAQHSCKVVGVMDSSTSIGVGISGSGNAVVTPIVTAAKKGWLCDDGITYWKEA